MTNKMRILYAEDNKVDAELTKMILEEHEFIVDIAVNGEEAWMLITVKSLIFYYSTCICP